jgi:hypothetical protein
MRDHSGEAKARSTEAVFGEDRDPPVGERVVYPASEKKQEGKSVPLPGRTGPELLPQYRAVAKSTQDVPATREAGENKGEQGGPSPARRLSGPELELIGLVGTEMPAVLIPASTSRPITQIEFDQDKLWQYDVARYDLSSVVLTKKHAERDQAIPVPNSLATDYVKNHSDAAKETDSRLDSPKELYGDVIVLGYEPVLEMIRGLTEELNELKRTLERIDPFRGFEEEPRAD